MEQKKEQKSFSMDALVAAFYAAGEVSDSDKERQRIQEIVSRVVFENGDASIEELEDVLTGNFRNVIDTVFGMNILRCVLNGFSAESDVRVVPGRRRVF